MEHVKADYGMETVDSAKVPKDRYGDPSGSSKTADAARGRIFRTGENTALLQLSCGDYLGINLPRFIEMLQTVQGLEIVEKIPEPGEDEVRIVS
jgi:hypothetical protein